MDRSKLIKTVGIAAGVLGVVAGGGWFAIRSYRSTHPDAHAHSAKHGHGEGHSGEEGSDDGEESEVASEASHSGRGGKKPGAKSAQPTGTWGAIAEASRSIQEKVDRLSRSEEENERLKLENANLRLQVQSLQFACDTRDARAKAHEVGDRLTKDTGTRIGRTLASIEYKPPAHLLPEQLYTLGVGYFRAKDDEKAAVIFSILTDGDDSQFRTPANFLMAGVSWYRLDNYELADQYFDRVLKAPETPETLQFKAQARLWHGLSAARVNKHGESQQWLKDLIDHHPHSSEASWINGGTIETASSESEEEDAHEKHGAGENKGHAPARAGEAEEHHSGHGARGVAEPSDPGAAEHKGHAPASESEDRASGHGQSAKKPSHEESSEKGPEKGNETEHEAHHH